MTAIDPRPLDPATEGAIAWLSALTAIRPDLSARLAAELAALAADVAAGRGADLDDLDPLGHLDGPTLAELAVIEAEAADELAAIDADRPCGRARRHAGGRS